MISVGVLGATGVVGQQFLQLLENHPWFEVTYLAASNRSAGKTLREAIQGRQLNSLSSELLSMPVQELNPKNTPRLVFSALDSDIAKEIEPAFASAGAAVVSAASAHRWASDVPLIVPEINASHLAIIPIQQRLRNWQRGFLVVKPNCSLQSYLTPLFALHQHFPIRRIILTTMQAISGAGFPGTASLSILDNVIPHIAGEEEKSEKEPLKILGSIIQDQIIPLSDIQISAHCNRVPVLDGHLACVSVEFKDAVPSQIEVLSIWNSFKGLNLPSAPKKPIHYREEQDRPQPRLDRDNDLGMAVTVGRLRPCPSLHLRFVCLSHNTLRGAAKGCILTAELLKEQNFL